MIAVGVRGQTLLELEDFDKRAFPKTSCFMVEI